jgi:hypothetical protein
MARAYTPGLKVSTLTRHKVHRILPIPGKVLVEEGEQVTGQQIIAQTHMPGEITPLNMANLLSLPPADVPGCMLKDEGDPIEVGDAVARTKGIFGMFQSDYVSKVSGTIESISSITGQVIVRGQPLPVEVQAYLAGTVTQVIPNEGCVIEADAAFIQGIFGIGGEAFGPIRLASKTHEQPLTEDLITSDMKGAVIIGGARMTETAIERARSVGASAVVSGGIDDEDLRTFLGYDLGVAITGSEEVGLTLIVTEGFGDIAMAERTFMLLSSLEGKQAAVNGATQIRAGVMRPEIIVPLPDSVATNDTSDREQGYLDIDAPVRIIRDPYFGLIGSVNGLPSEPQILESGSKARVLEVKLDSGESVIIPRANVELIEE